MWLMSEKRMFSKVITESDAFLDLPLSTQALYFHLAMQADDDGFVSSPNKVRRMTGATQNEYDLLIAKRFVLQFDDGIIVIKHFLMHNYIRKDRYNPSTYLKEKAMLFIKENKAYTLDSNQGLPIGIPMVDVNKSSIDKSSIDKSNIDIVVTPKIEDIKKQYDLAIKMSLDYDYELIRKEFKGSLISNNAKKKLPSLIEKYGGIQMLEVVKRYNLYVINKRKKEQPNLNYMIESTFWNGRYEDYLDCNYQEHNAKKETPKINRNNVIEMRL